MQKEHCRRCRGPWVWRLDDRVGEPWTCPGCVRFVRLERLPREALDPDGKTRGILEALEDADTQMQQIARRFGVNQPRVGRVYRDRRELRALLGMEAPRL